MNSDPKSWPRVTVVTPSFRQGQFLETTILSVLGQCYPNLEYIIMDGGSDDGSVQVIERYAAKIAHWQSAPDRGQSDALNQGFGRATGDILCWVNSDDFLLPGTLHKIVRQLLPSLGKPALVYGSCFYFRESDGSARILKARPYDPDLLRETDYIYQPSAFWTKTLWERNGSLDSELHFGFDWDWFIRATAHCDFLRYDEMLSAYRRHAAHKSGAGGDARKEEIFRVVRRYGSAEQVRAYEYALAKYDDYQRRNRWSNWLRRWSIPFPDLLSDAAAPALWRLPEGVSRERLRRCLAMLGPS